MYVRIHVVPGAKREIVKKASETEFTISVREPAERNLANRRVCTLISEIFHVPVGKVRMVTGHRSSTKMVDVEVD